MSPRRNHRADDAPEPLDDVRARRGVERVHTGRDGDWMVRAIPGDASVKTYRCPGCDQEIQPGTAHVVAWPDDERGDVTNRRHWHTGCWRSRGSRAPRIVRKH